MGSKRRDPIYSLDIFRDFKLTNPKLVEKVVDYYPCGYASILIRLKGEGRSELLVTYSYYTRKLRLVEKPNGKRIHLYKDRDAIGEAFAHNLSVLLADRGISQKELAYESNVSQPTISEIVRYKRIPGMHTIMKIAYALDVSVSELCGDPIRS